MVWTFDLEPELFLPRGQRSNVIVRGQPTQVQLNYISKLSPRRDSRWIDSALAYFASLRQAGIYWFMYVQYQPELHCFAAHGILYIIKAFSTKVRRPLCSQRTLWNRKTSADRGELNSIFCAHKNLPGKFCILGSCVVIII